MQNELQVAREACAIAGRLLARRHLEEKVVHSAIGRDIKLGADREADEAILQFLKAHSEYSILTEESGEISGRTTDRRWIVDPLDGSFNFFRQLPLCCISIALWDRDRPLLGVIWDLNREAVFAGIVGEGAWLNGEAIRVSATEIPGQAVLATGFPVAADLNEKTLVAYASSIQRYKKIRMLGTAALSLAYVAAGNADIYLEKGIKLWDVAAGIALVRAAGGHAEFQGLSGNGLLHVFASNEKLKAEQPF